MCRNDTFQDARPVGYPFTETVCAAKGIILNAGNKGVALVTFSVAVAELGTALDASVLMPYIPPHVI